MSRRYGYYTDIKGRYYQIDFTRFAESSTFISPAYKTRCVDPADRNVVTYPEVQEDALVPICPGDLAELDEIRRKEVPADILWAFPNKPEKGIGGQ